MTLAGTTLADFIVGGEEVKGNDWENVVALSDNKGNLFCSGTAIDSKTIKSAAHCLVNDDFVAMITENIFKPLFIASDNLNLTKETMIKSAFTKDLIDGVLKAQELLKTNTELAEHLTGSIFNKYIYIYVTLDTVFKNYAKENYKIYRGNGSAGGKVANANYKISDVSISQSYLSVRAIKSALSLGLDPAKDADLKNVYYQVLNDNRLDNLTITLEEDLPISNFVPSITPDEISEIDYKTVQLVGFGRTVDPNEKKDDTDYGVKREVTVDYVGFSQKTGNFVTHSPNKSACYGDSGGSAFVKLVNGELRYLGVISSGIGINGVKGLEIEFSNKEMDARCGSDKVATMIVPAYL